MQITNTFFNRDAIEVAQDLLGKVIRAKVGRQWLSAHIIETEAYFIHEKGSHASLGYTEKRKALFMQPGTIYMYYARGGDSLNISCRGEGNAVLVKSGFAIEGIKKMQQLNPKGKALQLRAPEKLCSGQTLLCKSLNLLVKKWDQKQFNKACFYIADYGHRPHKIIQTRRLGIPKGRDEDLLYRFVDYNLAEFCTENPLRKRKWQLNRDYFVKEIE